MGPLVWWRQGSVRWHWQVRGPPTAINDKGDADLSESLLSQLLTDHAECLTRLRSESLVQQRQRHGLCANETGTPSQQHRNNKTRARKSACPSLSRPKTLQQHKEQRTQRTTARAFLPKFYQTFFVRPQFPRVFPLTCTRVTPTGQRAGKRIFAFPRMCPV